MGIEERNYECPGTTAITEKQHEQPVFTELLLGASTNILRSFPPILFFLASWETRGTER